MSQPEVMMPCPHCGASRARVSPDVCASCGGSLVVCGFRMEALLGRGSTGAVYAATHVEHGTRAAVKVRSLADRGSWRAHERFETSAQFLRGIEHPGLPRVHAFEPMGTRGRAFLVLERFGDGEGEGQGTLHARIAKQRGRLDDQAMRALLRGILAPLGFLHDRGLVHRDVSPRNVMFRDSLSNQSAHEAFSRPVLVDCDSLAPVGEDEGTSFVGTPGFVAPEQIAGAATCASDVYSAGATVLFAASRAHLSSDLRAVLLTMTARDPLLRPRNAAAALALLDAPPVRRVAPRRRLATAATIAIAVTSIGAVPWQHADTPSADAEPAPVAPHTCRIVSMPSGAAVYATRPDVAWDLEHPLDEVLGRTPYVISRAEPRTIVVHKSGFRPYLLSVGTIDDQPCSFVARLTPE